MDRNLIDNLMDSRKLETMDRESGNKVYNKYFVPKYSIVVPLHNEQENVTDLYDRLKVVMETHGETFEIVLVDDGSSDHTFAMLREIAAVDSRVTVDEDYAATLDRRLALPLDSITLGANTLSLWMVICSMIPATFRCSWRRLPRDTTLSAGGARIASTISGCAAFPAASPTGRWQKFPGVDIHDFGTTFKAYRRDILEQVPLYGELHRFIPALASWHGASICAKCRSAT